MSNILDSISRAFIADSETRQVEAIARTNPAAAAKLVEERDKTGRVVIYAFLGIFAAITAIVIYSMVNATKGDDHVDMAAKRNNDQHRD